MKKWKDSLKNESLTVCQNCEIIKEFGECDLGCEILEKRLKR